MGYRSMRCPAYVKVERMERNKGWLCVFPQRNAVGFTSKSLHWNTIRSYGSGLLMEKGSLSERRDWYRRNRRPLPRKMKKKLIGTRRRK